MTTGQRVNPAKALSGGYVFHFPTLEPALRAIMTKG
jgi:NAD dependent epimerase/dehydratase family enzyme